MYELYDLKKDRHQINNLAGNKDYAAIKKQLHEQLMAEMNKYEDPRLVDAFDRPPYLVDGRGPKGKKKK